MNNKKNNNPFYKWGSTILCLLMVVLGLLILIHFSSVLLKPLSMKCQIKDCITKYIEGPTAFNDIQMAAFVKRKYMVSPTSGEYNLSGETNEGSTFENEKKIISELFKNKTKGTFAVIGAGDGEFRDLSLSLERNQDWTGLLVEPNPYLYNLLKSKGRNAIITNLCMSPYIFSKNMVFGYQAVLDNDSLENKTKHWRNTKILQTYKKSERSSLTTFKQLCIPLDSILFAAGFTEELDLLILDMSNTDIIIIGNLVLKNLPKVKVLIIVSAGEDMSQEYHLYFIDCNIMLKKIIGHFDGRHIYLFERVKDVTEVKKEMENKLKKQN